MKYLAKFLLIVVFYVLLSCALEIVAGNSLRPPHPDVLKEQEIEHLLQEDARLIERAIQAQKEGG